jgi:hypothetical protein
MCPVILNSTCVFYEGNTLTYTGITTNDSIQTALQKIDAKFGDSHVGYIFTNGVVQLSPGQPVKLGGSLIENTTIGGNFTLSFVGPIIGSKLATAGGTASQFLKGDGTLDSTPYQVAGAYITNLSGDVVASGPGTAVATLASVNGNPGIYGDGTHVPRITVDSKGRVTAVTSTAISLPSSVLSFTGDVYGSGSTGSTTTLTLNDVNLNVYSTNTFLKFKVNAKGLVTGATPVTGLDINSALGFTPVPNTRTITINGVTQTLQADRSWTLPGGGSVTSVSATAGTGISVSVTNPTTAPNITITNTAPDQVVSIAAGTGINVSGTYPNFTVAATNTGSVTGVTASSPLASSGGTTPNITISQASGSTDGYLSSTDWNTFNGKQAAGNYITELTGEASASGPGSATVTLSNSAVTGKVLTGVNITGGTVVATDSILEAFGKVQNQINGLIGGSIYKGTWNASTNTPTITSGVGTTGWYYIVSVPGSTNIDGITDWNLGDWIIFDGTAWQQVDNTDAVVSVNGYTGAVSLVSSDIPEGLTNLYYTPARARTAISLTTTGTSGAATYDNVTGVLNVPNYTPDLSGYVPTSRTLTINGTSYDLTADRSWTIATGSGTVTSVALTVPSAFSVSGSPITTSGTLAITANGDTTQYIAGDGSLVSFPITGQAGTLVRQVRNITGATLTKGTVVYINGANGNKPTVTKAIATSDMTSAQTFGLVQSDIANNANGYVVCTGDLIGLDTQAFAEGAQLYLSSTVAGTYTTTKQYAPAHLVYIGVVTRSHPTQGQIEVKIQNGYEMDELHDVSAQTPSNNDGIFYNTSTSLWENKSIATALGYTPANAARTISTTAPLQGGGDLSANRTFSITQSTTSTDGYLSSTDWNTFNGKQAGSANLTSLATLAYVSESFVKMTGANTFALDTTAYYPASNPNGYTSNTGTVTSVAALTIGTTGTDISSSVANGTTTPVITLNIPTASASNRGALSAADWATFNSKQNAFTGTTNYIAKFTGTSAIGDSMIYDSGTAVGINTAAPDALFHVYYNSGSSTTYTDVALFGRTGERGLYVGANGYGFSLNSAANGAGWGIKTDWDSGFMRFHYGASTKAQIQSNGQLKLNAYTSTTSFTGTVAGVLGFDSSGNIITTTAGGTTLNGTGFVKASGTTISYDNSTYVPTTGTGATGSWGISVTGTASNITAYTINQNLGTGNTPTFADVYTNGWFRNNASGQGLYNQAVSNHFYASNSNDWNIAATGAYPKLWLRDGYGGTSKLALYTDSTASGLLNSASYWGVRMPYGSGYTGGVELYGPIAFKGQDNNVAGMKMVSHSVNKVGSSKFLKIYAGVNNYFTGFIFGFNFDNYPPNSTANTGAGFAYQFGGWTDGSGSTGDKYFDLQWFGGNNVGNLGREMNTDGNGYIITTPTSTGAGGYKVSATVMIFARDATKLSFTYY